MANARVSISMVVELLGHDHGHWCRACALSTGIRVFVAVRRGDGSMSLQARTHCQECGSRDIVIDPEPRHC